MNGNPIRFDTQHVLKLLPHRYPWLLIDRVLALEPRKAVTALKNVTVNEPYFVGHYPGSPVMPGVLCIEALLQTAMILVSVEGETGIESNLHKVIEIERARFRRSVYPGDQLLIHVELKHDRDGVCLFQGSATVDGAIAVEASISLTRSKKDLCC
ncbi:3-hydroxyacyl-ACP dehydratase FabZ [Cupriavidus basilensis]|uniref:3-hydroxyacyl-[acyl-carrier-protein] dehydratase FabZ n=1 Tax=Cupriavidus basilensis TaxID=68895 RepID=A0ABT6ART3_9BURK|nr:3-hydroxyacyl-ACP dehydratase FabZ [Cupriavidus basilensis]MDF3835336.1 3-hydroxyacyl-ACP dehydratase FabZ [Cupriavidus basilensis]